MCSAFDEALAREGPAAVFLPDREGRLRFDAEWTRDAWERAPGPHPRAHVWVLLRDRDTGFVSLALVTSPNLLASHPRADVRAFSSLEDALEKRRGYGTPPVTRVQW